MSEERKKISISEAISSEYVRFPDNERIRIAFTNFGCYIVTKPSYNDASIMKELPQFEATVIAVNGAPVEKKLTQLSKLFMAELEPFIKDKPETDIIYVAVKRIVKDNKVTYDIEDDTPKAQS